MTEESGQWWAGQCTCLSCFHVYTVTLPYFLVEENIPTECPNCGKISEHIYLEFER